MAISTLYPSSRPSLSLDFAKSKRLDPRISFTRAQTGNIASYVDSNGLIRLAGPDEPRFDHDPNTGESLGLLIEESRTNLILHSENLANFNENGGGTANLDSSVVDPSGNTGTVYWPSNSELIRTFNANGATKLSASFFAKKRFGGLERNYNYIEFFQWAVGGGDLGVYSFAFDGNNPDSTYVKNIKTISYPNGWYRFTFQLLARPDYNGGVFSQYARFDIEGGSSDNYIWGVQVERDSEFSTSYIPTSGSTVTRSAENVSISGSNFNDWYNQIEGTFYTQTEYRGYASVIFELSPSSPRTVLGSISANIAYINKAGGVVYTSNSPISPGVFNKISVTDKSADGSLFVNGSLVGNSNGTSSTIYTGVVFGNSAFSERITGHIKRFAYYPQRLTDARLQTMTR